MLMLTFVNSFAPEDTKVANAIASASGRKIIFLSASRLVSQALFKLCCLLVLLFVCDLDFLGLYGLIS
jgi:hypothetical protein